MGQPVRQRWESQPIPQGLRIGQHPLQSERPDPAEKLVLCVLYFPSEDGTSFKGQTLYFLIEDGTYFNLKCDRTFKKKKKWLRHCNSVYKISVTRYNTHRRV